MLLHPRSAVLLMPAGSGRRWGAGGHWTVPSRPPALTYMLTAGQPKRAKIRAPLRAKSSPCQTEVKALFVGLSESDIRRQGK